VDKVGYFFITKGEYMSNDFDLIVDKFSRDKEYINVYPLGDLHIGSDEFDLDKWKRWKQMVMNDPNSVIVTIGDLVDNGLRNSIGNPFEQTMRPREQKEWLAKELRPMADKILVGVQGNHEHRTSKVSDGCAMRDVMFLLGIEDRYRENAGFLKIALGSKSHDRQWTYTFALFHGASKFKTRVMGYAIDGMDALITGHDHQPQSYFPAKIVIDSKNETVSMKGFTRLVVSPFLKMGGYGMKAMYEPQDHTKIPIIRLDGKKKDVNVLWV